MDTKYNASTDLRPEGERILDAPLVQVDIPNFIRQIRSENAWHNSDRNAMTVYKTEGVSVVLIALHEKALIAKHTAAGVINVQVLEGEIRFSTDEQDVLLKKGQLLALHKRVPHSVLAIQESVFMLTHFSSSAK